MLGGDAETPGHRGEFAVRLAQGFPVDGHDFSRQRMHADLDDAGFVRPFDIEFPDGHSATVGEAGVAGRPLADAGEGQARRGLAGDDLAVNAGEPAHVAATRGNKQQAAGGEQEEGRFFLHLGRVGRVSFEW